MTDDDIRNLVDISKRATRIFNSDASTQAKEDLILDAIAGKVKFIDPIFYSREIDLGGSLLDPFRSERLGKFVNNLNERANDLAETLPEVLDEEIRDHEVGD